MMISFQVNLRIPTYARVGLAALVVLLVQASRANAYDPTAFHATVLHDHGIPSNVDGLRAFLHEVVPDANGLPTTDTLLRQLRSPAYSERVYAAAALSRTVPFPQEALEQAVEGNDADVRRRAEEILLNRRDEFDYLVYAALEFIAAKPVRGLVPELARMLPACPALNQQVALRFALVQSATPSDRDIVVALLTSPEPAYRIMALHTLSELFPDEAALAWLLPALRDENKEVQLEAASRLAQLGHKSGVQDLVTMLDQDAVNIRGQAAFLLRNLTGQQFGFSCHGTPEQRGAAVARWQHWVDAQQRTVVFEGKLSDHYVYPRMLVSLVNHDLVQEMDLAGEVIMTLTGYKHPWSVQLFPNGHKMVSWRDDGQCLAEYDLAGREIWRSEVIFSQPRTFKMLENGNIWIACNSHPTTIEMDRNSNRIRERPFDPDLGQLKDGVLLDNGHLVLLFTDKGLMREIDTNGIIVREIENLEEPYSIQVLANGHVLISESGAKRVIELDKKDEVLWSYDTPEPPRNAQRLANGHTLISTFKTLREISPDGGVVWEKSVPGPARAIRF